MKLVWKSFSLCKDGNREDENEDAVSPQLANGIRINGDRFSCAMSDGATASSFSKLWAALLVNEASLSHDMQKDFFLTINNARMRWKTQLDGNQLTWPAMIKVRQGAFATLLWFHIWHQNGFPFQQTLSNARGWTAHAVGDTCLFQVNKGRFIGSYPLTKADQFNNTPDLISTNAAYQRITPGKGNFSGEWQKGDHFLISSDALAQWIVRKIETNTMTWPMVSENLTSLVRYQTWIRSLRRQGQIKNDDTSLISISVDD